MKKMKAVAGRPKIYKTEAERKAARRKQNQAAMEKVKTARKKSYAEDPVYRAAKLASVNKHYRETHPNFQPLEYGKNAGKAAEFGESRKPFGGGRSTVVLTEREMSCFLGMAEKTLAKWIEGGKFPAPQIMADFPEGGMDVYTATQANLLAKLLAEGLKGKGKFRASDTALVERLMSVMK